MHQQFLRAEEAILHPEAILPTHCIVTTLTWGVDERVRTATEGQPGPRVCPDNRVVGTRIYSPTKEALTDTGKKNAFQL